jgi:hypothetical protein
MRSCVTEIAEIAEDEPAGPGRPAASDVLAACGHTLGAVDQLLAGITEARRQPARLWRPGGDQEAFAASRAMLRLLLADRADVDAASRELLRAAGEYLRHPPAPVTGPGGQAGSARRDGGSPAEALKQEEPVSDHEGCLAGALLVQSTVQWGGPTPKAGGRLLDGRTWDQMPAGAAGPGGGR